MMLTFFIVFPRALEPARDELRRCPELLQNGVAEIHVEDFLDSRFSDAARYAQGDAVGAVLAREKNADGEDLVGAHGNGLDDLGDGGAGRVVGA